MAAMVLSSPSATVTSVYVVRAFVQLRESAIANKELARRLGELESRIERKLSPNNQCISPIQAFADSSNLEEPGRAHSATHAHGHHDIFCPETLPFDEGMPD